MISQALFKGFRSPNASSCSWETWARSLSSGLVHQCLSPLATGSGWPWVGQAAWLELGLHLGYMTRRLFLTAKYHSFTPEWMKSRWAFLGFFRMKSFKKKPLGWDLRSTPQAETHMWSWKPDQSPMTREVLWPTGESITANLLNGHAFKLSSNLNAYPYTHK